MENHIKINITSLIHHIGVNMANQYFVFTDAMEVVGIDDRKRILIMNRLGNVGFKETLEKTASIIHTFLE